MTEIPELNDAAEVLRRARDANGRRLEAAEKMAAADPSWAEIGAVRAGCADRDTAIARELTRIAEARIALASVPVREDGSEEERDGA